MMLFEVFLQRESSAAITSVNETAIVIWHKNNFCGGGGGSLNAPVFSAETYEISFTLPILTVQSSFRNQTDYYRFVTK
jgi:hypothetical protein